MHGPAISKVQTSEHLRERRKTIKKGKRNDKKDEYDTFIMDGN